MNRQTCDRVSHVLYLHVILQKLVQIFDNVSKCWSVVLLSTPAVEHQIVHRLWTALSVCGVGVRYKKGIIIIKMLVLVVCVSDK